MNLIHLFWTTVNTDLQPPQTLKLYTREKGFQPTYQVYITLLLLISQSKTRHSELSKQRVLLFWWQLNSPRHLLIKTVTRITKQISSNQLFSLKLTEKCQKFQKKIWSWNDLFGYSSYCLLGKLTKTKPWGRKKSSAHWNRSKLISHKKQFAKVSTNIKFFWIYVLNSTFALIFQKSICFSASNPELSVQIKSDSGMAEGLTIWRGE